MTQPMLDLSMIPGSGRFSRRCISLENAAFVGRATEVEPKSVSNAFFDSAVVSRKHGMFYYRDGKFFYRDSKSLNGSWINDLKIPANEEKMLANGDIIQLGVDIGENSKILAKILLTYPHVHDSIIPSSIGPPEPVLDQTASLDDLIEILESNQERTAYEQTSLEKMKLAKKKADELGISKKEALQMMDY